MKWAVDDLAAVLAPPEAFVLAQVIVECGIRTECAAAHRTRILRLVELIFVAEHGKALVNNLVR
jgi:hypothetical protein